jgi:hypothetical protein
MEFGKAADEEAQETRLTSVESAIAKHEVKLGSIISNSGGYLPDQRQAVRSCDMECAQEEQRKKESQATSLLLATLSVAPD